MGDMDFTTVETIYKAISRIFDGFLNFLYEVFGKKESEEETV